MRFGIADRLRLSTNITEATFDEDRNVWGLVTDAGERHEFDVLICACGQLSDPAFPNIEGRDDFAGHSFHSAEWDHDHDLSGERVAVIGTGASAIQFIPEVAAQAAELHLYQRSAPWIIPKPDREFSPRHHRLFKRFPRLLAAERLGWYLFCEYGQSAVTTRPRWLAPWTRASRRFMRREVRDAAKRKALTPTYQAGCKRLLFSNDYYAAMARENVQIVTDDIARITPTGVVAADGVAREADTIIYATGFQAHGFVAPMTVTGRGGQRLAEDAWSEGARAYLGITVTGFPNLFVLYGPNTNLGGGSIVYMIESAARYITQAVRHLTGRPGVALDLHAEKLESFDVDTQHRLSNTLWATGCQSWYLDKNGRNSNNWPGTMREYRRRTAIFRPTDYELLAVPERAGQTAGHGASTAA